MPSLVAMTVIDFIVITSFGFHLTSLSFMLQLLPFIISQIGFFLLHCNQSSGVGMVNLGINVIGFTLGAKNLWSCLSGFGNKVVEIL